MLCSVVRIYTYIHSGEKSHKGSKHSSCLQLVVLAELVVIVMVMVVAIVAVSSSSSTGSNSNGDAGSNSSS